MKDAQALVPSDLIPDNILAMLADFGEPLVPAEWQSAIQALAVAEIERRKEPRADERLIAIAKERGERLTWLHNWFHSLLNWGRDEERGEWWELAADKIDELRKRAGETEQKP